MSNIDEELTSFKLQLQQVEAALLGDPDNEELLNLKSSLEEIIQLQEDLKADASAGGDGSMGSSSASLPQSTNNHIWTVGERVMAPLPDGRRVMAKIDSLTPAGAAITFISSGQQTIVDTSELQLPPENQRKNFTVEKKNYVFDKTKKGDKKEWHLEKEHRKQRAQKKELKRKELDSVKEQEKTSWQKFNNKAIHKGMKGLKKVTATASSQDGPSHGLKRETTISSRANEFQLRTYRGAMDSLF
ncbi:hypothetical protein WR25_11402 [Diploscapter pachys]|uniref:Tudor domain-containing protein n=1 Tax=Diploscapter pachys TaxID=2018661 RepID=A0A2A2L327_9BILA|nr:hypothetical protein WR25_11402 [Diploscapter pachys]